MTESTRRVSGGYLVYQQLRRRILSMDLKPGQRLFEPELATTMGVSRTPLREALRLLLAEDLLEQLPTGGMVVRQVSAKDIAELYSVRSSLEGLMAAEASRRLDNSAIEELTALVERNERLIELPDDAMNAGRAFHARIAQASAHGWASRLHDQIDGHMDRYRVFTNQSQERRWAALAEHRAILAALVAGDESAARKAAEEHVLRAKEAALASIGEHVLD